MSNVSRASAGSLDAAQLAILSAVVERLIPTDDRGPGAREAQAARYIATALGAEYGRYLADYQAGLASIDARARAAHGRPFVSLGPLQQDGVLADTERGQAAGDGPSPRTFFDLVLKHTREGVFGDPRWGGNADRVGWNMIGYPGPRHRWAAEAQRVEVIRDV
jgi:gluconate 2-dehydrogenase gamma chain